MHKELGKLGYSNAMHYYHVTYIAGREITSLTQLTDSEARQVWAYTKELMEMHERPVSDEEAQR